MAVLTDLPADLIFETLSWLNDPRDLLNVGLTCKQLHEESQSNILWAGLTRRFKYWCTVDFRPLANPDWQSEIKRRYEQCRQIDSILDSLIANPDMDIMPKFKTVLDELGIHSKDRCLFHMQNTPDNAPDVLARRYWSKKLFGAVNRQCAVPLMAKICKEESLSLEHLLTGVDMMIIESETADFKWVACELDQLAEEFKAAFSEWKTMRTYDLVVMLANFLVETKHFTGRRNFADYQGNLMNGLYQPHHLFISMTLADPLHCGTDLVYTVIFAAILQRLKIVAHVLSLSGHHFIATESGLNEDNLVYDIFNSNHGWKTKEEVATEVAKEVAKEAATNIQIGQNEDEQSQVWEIATPIKTLTTILAQACSALESAKTWLLLGGDGMHPETNDIQIDWRRFIDWLRLITAEPETREEIPREESLLDDPWEVYLIADFLRRVGNSLSSVKLFVQKWEHLYADSIQAPTNRISPDAPEPRYRIGDVLETSYTMPPSVVIQWKRSQYIEVTPDGISEVWGIFYVTRGRGSLQSTIIENSAKRVLNSNDLPLESFGRWVLRWDNDENRFISNRKVLFPEG